MTNEETQKDEEKESNKDAAVKPDVETLNTTDPQEHMEGPISSLMHKTGHGFESEEAEKEAKQKKENGK
ncbi:MAG: hypothetical protein ABIO55_01045 [Ginsengibacter sp.]